MPASRWLSVLLYSYLSSLFLRVAAQDGSRCYTMGGKPINDPNVIPCKDGPHSACCNQGLGDVCLTTGLCLLLDNTGIPSRMLWINGCTDPTWRDPACPQYCKDVPGATRDSYNPSLRPCTPSTWCCAGLYETDEECCQHDFNLTSSQGVGKIERILVNPLDGTSSSTITPAISDSPSNSTGDANNNENTCEVPAEDSSTNTTNPNSSSSTNTNSTPSAIAGGILGTLLLGVSIAFAFLFVQYRRLKKRLLAEVDRRTAGNDGNPTDTYKFDHEHQQQHHLSPGGTRVTVVAEVADPHYGVSPPVWVPTELPASGGRG